MSQQATFQGDAAAAPREVVVRPHSLLDDIYGIVVGVLFVATGMLLLQAAGLITGGVAGIALLSSYITPLPVGVLFMLINVPFFLFGYVFMGLAFTLKSLAGSVLIMGLLKFLPGVMVFGLVEPVVAALAGGTFCGMGVLAMARHGAGVGGTGIVTLWLQQRFGINAGRSQVAIDTVILLAALAIVPPGLVGWSALSALAMSSMVMAWHRAGRYFGA